MDKNPRDFLRVVVDHIHRNQATTGILQNVVRPSDSNVRRVVRFGVHDRGCHPLAEGGLARTRPVLTEFLRELECKRLILEIDFRVASQLLSVIIPLI